MNDGKCLDGIDDFGCSCPSEFKGKTCQCTLDDDSDECLSFDLSVFLGTDPSHRDDEDTTTPTTTSITITTIATTTQDLSTLELDVDYEYLEDQTSTDISSSSTEVTESTPHTSPNEEEDNETTIKSIQVDRLDETVPELDPSLQPISGLEPHMEMDIDSEFSVTPILPEFPTSTIVYNGTDLPPATSVFIYEPSSTDITTKSFLAGDDFIITTSPGYDKDDRGLDVGSIIIQPTAMSTIPVTVISQVSLDIVSTPMLTPTSSATIPVTIEQTPTPSITEVEEDEEDLKVTTKDPNILEQEIDVDESTDDNETIEDSTVTDSAQQWTVPSFAEDTTEEPTSTVTTTSTSTTTDAKPDLEMDIPEDVEVDVNDDEETRVIGTTTEPLVSSETSPDQDGSLSVENLTNVQCENLVCKNGGVCLNTLQGARCHCALRYRGAQCEEELHVDTPGFLGHSLLVHKLEQNISLSEAPFSLRLSFQSSSPVGVIFYTTGKLWN